MKKILTALSVLVVLASCQKEISLEDPNRVPGNGGTGGGTSTSAGLLVRYVEVFGIDSTINLYSYDAAKRLVKIDITNIQGDYLTTKITRNANGIITKTVTISSNLIATGIDSVVNNYFYNASASRYTHMRHDLSFGSGSYSDSTVYGYDAGGNLTNWIKYTQFSSTPYEPYEKMEFSYTSGNLTTLKNYLYDLSASVYELTQTTNVTYDSKTNPLKLSVEGILLEMHTQFGNNNATFIEYKFDDPADDITTTATYSYNTNNKPVTGTITESSGGSSSALRFYYN